MKMMKKLCFKFPTMAATAIILLLGLLGSQSGCSAPVQAKESIQAEENGRLKVVATTTMLWDLVKEIGGEQVAAEGLMGPGIDPHLYQAGAGDVKKMQQADVIVYNGLHLEGKMGDLFASLAQQGREIICVEQGINSSVLLADEEDSQLYDPHIWFDVSIWQDAAKYVAERLGEVDPENRPVYAANLESYLKELDELDQYVQNRVAELAKENRVLITAHDAFRYFGNAYDFQVMGLQGISTDAEAGTADVSELAGFIAENQIRAIFVESSVPPKNLEALQAAVKAKGFAVEIGGELYSDSLGDAKSGHDSYLLTFRANVDTIVDALKEGAKDE